MDTNPMPISMFELNPAVRLMNTAWFMYGCMEREYLLTMRALAQPALRWTPPPARRTRVARSAAAAPQ